MRSPLKKGTPWVNFADLEPGKSPILTVSLLPMFCRLLDVISAIKSPTKWHLP